MGPTVLPLQMSKISLNGHQAEENLKWFAIHTVACPAICTELEAWSTGTSKAPSGVHTSLRTVPIVLTTLINI